MKIFLVHYETPEGGHAWAVIESGSRPRHDARLTWFAVYEVPAQIHCGASMFGDPTWYLRQMARKGELARV